MNLEASLAGQCEDGVAGDDGEDVDEAHVMFGMAWQNGTRCFVRCFIRILKV